jgi:hypothetical protein
MPAFLRFVVVGHQLVNADWNRFRPTNAIGRLAAMTRSPVNSCGRRGGGGRVESGTL